ncbi:MAG: alkaline phosphatase family protein [Erysipelotrichaceae bacterium]|nr:alkaline phosphatase family protein [Erysipelotrichaceae bacterium]
MIVNYEESILAYISAIRRYFSLSSEYEPEKRFMDLLDRRRPEKVFILLIDGMGARLIDRKLPEDAFLKKHMLYRTSTVFPSTTTSATTSIQNGKAPSENAWLGWCQYLKEADDIIIPFLSIGYYNDVRYEDHIMFKHIPVSTTENDLKKKGIGSRILFPSFAEDGCDDFDEMCQRLIALSHSDEYRYIYAYWDRYDTYMHEYGPSSKICDSYLEHINYEIENLALNLSDDTMLVVIADHGQVDINRYYNLYGSEFDRFFYRRPSLESRAQAFFIRKGMEKEFEKRFKEVFQDDYILLSHEQVLRSKLFGDHGNHPRFEEFIGDYLAIGKSDLSFEYHEREKHRFKGQHAGMSDDELQIPVIVWMK